MLRNLYIFPIILFLLLVVSYTAERIIIHNHLVVGDSCYVAEHKTFLHKTLVQSNPISYAYDHSEQFYNWFYRYSPNKNIKRLWSMFRRSSMDVPASERSEIVQELLSEREWFSSEQHLAYRSIQKEIGYSSDGDTTGAFPYNVVFIVLESWEDAKTSSLLRGKRPFATPFFEGLKKRSLVLNQCFANAYCSYQGEGALFSSLPIWGINHASMGGILFNTYTKSFLSVLKEHGYHTYFIHTLHPMHDSDLASFNLKFRKLNPIAFLNKKILPICKADPCTQPGVIAGVQEIADLFDDDLPLASVDKDMYSNDIHQRSGTIFKSNLADHQAFQKLYSKMTKLPEPFFVATHTFSSHWNVPIPYTKIDHTIDRAQRYFYGMVYSDQSLQAFFEKIKEHPVYKRTIFVLIADHTTGIFNRHRTLYHQYHIPALIHAPGLLGHKEVDKTTFQIDMGPTIVDLLRLPKGGRYTTLGSSVLNEEKNRGVILPDQDGCFVFVNDPYIMRIDLSKKEGLSQIIDFYNFRVDPDQNLRKDPTHHAAIYKVYQESLRTYVTFADIAFSNTMVPYSEVAPS